EEGRGSQWARDAPGRFMESLPVQNRTRIGTMNAASKAASTLSLCRRTPKWRGSLWSAPADPAPWAGGAGALERVFRLRGPTLEGQVHGKAPSAERTH